MILRALRGIGQLKYLQRAVTFASGYLCERLLIPSWTPLLSIFSFLYLMVDLQFEAVYS